MEFENVIGILNAEIDSLKDPYKQENIQDRKTVYSTKSASILKLLLSAYHLTQI